MAGLIDVYEYAFQGISDVNLQATVRAFIQGECKRNNAFRPSPAELAAYARPMQIREDRIKQASNRIEGQKQITNDWRAKLSEKQHRAHVEARLGTEAQRKKQIPAMDEADPNRPKPWMDPAEMKTSSMSIRRELAESGEPLFPEDADL
ncbi:MAG: hypothetical protein GY807_20990 [Gammaproteobacteria bacterium]|nr:hypothetical protein [Gammaproteobacteria bacterium]